MNPYDPEFQYDNGLSRTFEALKLDSENDDFVLSNTQAEQIMADKINTTGNKDLWLLRYCKVDYSYVLCCYDALHNLYVHTNLKDYYYFNATRELSYEDHISAAIGIFNLDRRNMIDFISEIEYKKNL